MSTDLPIQPKSSELTNGRDQLYAAQSFTAASGFANPADAWGNGPAQSGGGVARYLGIINRYKWVILLIIALGTGLGALASRMVIPTYQVQARLWLDLSNSQRGPIEDAQLLGGKDNTPWLDLLTSYSVLDHVVETQRLYLETDRGNNAAFANFQLKERFLPGDYRVSVSSDGRELTLETLSGTLVEKVAAGDSLGRSVGFAWVPSAKAIRNPNGIPFSVLRPRDKARELASRLGTRIPKNGTFVHIDLTDTDPVRAAASLNGIIDRFTSLAAELKSARLKETATALDDQLALAQQNLQNAEMALEGFRVRTITQPTESPTGVAAGIAATTSPMMTNFMTLRLQQDGLRRDRAAIARALQRAATSEVSTPELETIASVQGSAEIHAALTDLTAKRSALRTLQYKYTDEYIDVKKLRAEIQTLEKETIPRLLRELMAELDRRDAQAETQVVSASSEMRQIPPRVMEEARLSRQVSITDKIYTTLRARHEEARLAALSSTPDVRIVDRAVTPQKPLQDRRMFPIMAGFGASLAIVVLGVLVLDKFDRRVRFPEEVTHGLRLPILAAIPRLKSSNGNGRRTDTSHVIEAFRGLRMTMLQERGTQGCLISAITSPGSGDGKSFVAVNLAFALADQGYRTLLIDGDIRRGGLHHFLGGTRKPGLTDYLAGTASETDVIQSTSYPLLDLVASGRRLQTGPELLGSQKLPDFLRELRSQYAVVLIDTPPLGAGIDPFVLGMAAGNMVLVLRTGMSDMEFTEAKLTLLDRLPVRVVGAILNGVPSGGAYKYYGYISGYESADEESAKEAARLPALS